MSQAQPPGAGSQHRLGNQPGSGAGIEGESQHTLGAPITLLGVGLHSGADCAAQMAPAEAGTGIQFLLPGLEAPFRATIDAQVGDNRCTSLGAGGQVVQTVEHLLSALAGCGIDNCLVKVQGGEIPAQDGSSLPLVQAIQASGKMRQPVSRHYATLAEPVWIEEGASAIVALPSDSLHLTYGIDFGHKVLGKQLFSAGITEELYVREIAPARTFGFLHEVEELWRKGLARGGSLENAVVIGEEGYLTDLRFGDEPVRHKVLDLIGDLALLGEPLKAQIIALKSSHRLNTMLVRKILETRRI